MTRFPGAKGEWVELRVKMGIGTGPKCGMVVHLLVLCVLSPVINWEFVQRIMLLPEESRDRLSRLYVLGEW